MTIVSLIIVTALTVTFSEGKDYHMNLCFDDNAKEASCIDCSASKENFEMCKRYHNDTLGFDLREYEGFWMGWDDPDNIYVTAKQLKKSPRFTDDDRKAVAEVWQADCEESRENSVCFLADYAVKNF